jgi:predicted transcriptional regulator YheO
VYFHNKSGDIIAALCINVDLSGLQHARGILDALLPQSPALTSQPDEYIGKDLVAVMGISRVTAYSYLDEARSR